MGRGYAIALLAVVACSSSPTYVFGDGADKRIREALGDAWDGATALSTGRMIYVVPEGELVPERRKLLGTLRGAESVAPRGTIARGVDDISRAEARVMAFARPQVFETESGAGVLHVERVAEPGKPPSYYSISLREGRRVLTLHVRVSARLEGAWRALFDAARREGRVDPRLNTLPASSGSPLDAMRDIGVDLRGLEPQ